jgi:hypothetical protein
LLDEIYEYLTNGGNEVFTEKKYLEFLRDIAKAFKPENRALV